MKNRLMRGRMRYATVLLAAGSFLAFTGSHAEDAPDRDPARWHQDLTTPRARFENAKKESIAAYQEALTECKTKRRAEASACRKEAKRNFDADMADARKALSAPKPD